MYTPPKTIRTNYAARPKARYGVKPSPYHAAKSQDAGEPEVCDTIRRNIGIDSTEIATLMQDNSDDRDRIETAKTEIENLERDLKEITNMDWSEIHDMNLQIYSRLSGKAKNKIIRMLEYAGATLDAFLFGNAIRKSAIIRNAKRFISDRIDEWESSKSSAEFRIRDRQPGLNRLYAQIDQHFSAFEEFGCSGDPDDSYRHTPRDGQRSY